MPIEKVIKYILN